MSYPEGGVHDPRLHPSRPLCHSCSPSYTLKPCHWVFYTWCRSVSSTETWCVGESGREGSSSGGTELSHGNGGCRVVPVESGRGGSSGPGSTVGIRGTAPRYRSSLSKPVGRRPLRTPDLTVNGLKSRVEGATLTRVRGSFPVVLRIFVIYV